MTIEHKNIIDPNRHEPKGITGAGAGTVYVATGGGADSGTWEIPDHIGVSSASLNQFYIANGAGGGTWRYIPHSHCYYQGLGTAGTTITTPTVYTLVGPVTVSDLDPHDFTHNALGRLTYTGSPSLDGTVIGTITFKHSTGASIDCYFELIKNGVTRIGPEFVNTATSGNYTTLTLMAHGTMSTNDYIEVFCKCSSGNITIFTLTLDIDGRP